MEPVTQFIALIDGIIRLVKSRQTKRREYFDKIIDPLYAQFKPLGDDYINLFREAERAEASKSKRINAEVVERIRRRRDEFSLARAQLRALLAVCEKHAQKKRDSELREFLLAMSRFFNPLIVSNPFGSLGTELVQAFENAEKWVAAGQGVPIEFARRVRASLEGAWYEVAGRYMELKLKYLGE